MAGEESEKEALSDHAKALEASKYADEMDKLSQQAHTLSNAEKAAEADIPKD